MSTYIGEIRNFGFNWAPANWAHCDGQLLPIEQNMTLYCLIGSYFGGDGQTTFALPDLRGRATVHMGPGDWHGQSGPGSYGDLAPSAGQAPVAGKTVVNSCIALDGEFPSRY